MSINSRLQFFSKIFKRSSDLETYIQKAFGKREEYVYFLTPTNFNGQKTAYYVSNSARNETSNFYTIFSEAVEGDVFPLYEYVSGEALDGQCSGTVKNTVVKKSDKVLVYNRKSGSPEQGGYTFHGSIAGISSTTDDVSFAPSSISGEYAYGILYKSDSPFIVKDKHEQPKDIVPCTTERYEREIILSAGLSDEATDVNIRTRADKVRRGNKNGETRFFNETVGANALYLFTFAAGEHGSVSATVSGSVITSPYKAVYGTEISLSTTPETGYLFNKWSDGVDTSSRTVTLTNDISLTALFVVDPEPADYINTELLANGAIQSADSGISAELSDFPPSLFVAHKPIKVKIGGVDGLNVQFLFQKQLEYYNEEEGEGYWYEDDDCELNLSYDRKSKVYVFRAWYLKFQLTYSASEGGTITVVDENGNVIPSGTMLSSETEFSFSATPAAGYLFDRFDIHAPWTGEEDWHEIRTVPYYVYGTYEITAHFFTTPTTTIEREYNYSGGAIDVSGDEVLMALFMSPTTAYINVHVHGTWLSGNRTYDSTSVFRYELRDGGATEVFVGNVVTPDGTYGNSRFQHNYNGSVDTVKFFIA